jgi:hypothetical protein
MEIDESDEHPANISSSTDESLEADSNVTVEREEHPLKHTLQSRSTNDGMKIDESDEQEPKTAVSIHESFEPVSTMTAERDRQ